MHLRGPLLLVVAASLGAVARQAHAADGEALGAFPQLGWAIPSSPSVSSNGLTHAHFDRWRETLGPMTNPDGAVDTVLYPLGGADVEGAFATFTNGRGDAPRRLVIVDAF